MANPPFSTDGLSDAAKDVLRCLFFHGPTWDGDVPSKSGRDELVTAGYAERFNGWQWLRYEGVTLAIDCGLDRAKEKWQRDRRAPL
jgi:hypothetical protein